MTTARGLNRTLVLGSLAAALLSSGRAQADATCATDAFMHCEDGGADLRATNTAPAGDLTGGYAIEETKLAPRDEAPAAAKAWNPNVARPAAPSAFDERIAAHRNFVQPFLTPSVFPEISARVLNEGGYASRGHSAELDQLLFLSAYFVDVYAPLLTLRRAVPTSSDAFRMDLKAPFVFGRQAFTLFLGGNLPTSGTWADAGYNMMFGYALGGSVFSLQARAGVGFDQLIAEDVGPRGTSVLADIAASFALGRHASLLLQADGRKLVGQQGGTLRLWPGVRFYPLSEATLSLAVGAQLWMDSFTSSGAFTTFDVRRAGAFFDVGYVFF
jgi:hypothetical protein